jgi:hypothetical protein
MAVELNMGRRIQLRRDTATAWTAANSVLTQGEIGIDLTNNKIKIGDGVTGWNQLSYWNDQESDLSDYATIEYVDEAIGNIVIPDVSNFITENDLSGLATEEYVSTAVDNIEGLLPEGTRIVSSPTSSQGAAGDLAGDISFSNTHVYYCVANYTESIVELTSIASTGSAASVIVFYGPDNVPPDDMTGFDVAGPGNYIGSVTGPSIDQGGSMWHVPVTPDVTQETGVYTFGNEQPAIWKRIAWDLNNIW